MNFIANLLLGMAVGGALGAVWVSVKLLAILLPREKMERLRAQMRQARRHAA